MRKTILGALFVSLASPAFGAVKNSKLLTQVEDRYRAAKTVKMVVNKTLKMKLLEKEKRSEGLIQIKKGGKLRWETTSPEHSLIVVGKRAVWIVDYPADPEERIAILKATNPKKSQPQAVVAFLMGEGHISDEFRVKSEKKGEGGLTDVHLVPKLKTEQVRWLTLSVGAEKNIEKLSFEDTVGNITELTFKEIVFDSPMENKVFEFTPPENADVTVID
jgi:outer membrane lipoprotein carrier protein